MLMRHLWNALCMSEPRTTHCLLVRRVCARVCAHVCVDMLPRGGEAWVEKHEFAANAIASFTGVRDEEEIARVIATSVGPSGPNSE